MNNTLSTPQFRQQLIQLLHESFPDSRLVPAGQMNQSLTNVLQKAQGYGLDNQADLASYVITAYVLGENFDTEVPEAAQVLQNSRYSSHQKAAQLENWTKQVMNALEEDEGLAQQVAAKQAEPQTADASAGDYLTMQANAGPFRQVAEWAVARLRAGDAASVIGQFSPNFTQHLGQPTVERVFQEQMLPFFTGSTGLANGTTITMTHDSFGSEGFAFYLTLASPQGNRPFVLYVVNENNRIVVANLVLNKTYDDMH